MRHAELRDVTQRFYGAVNEPDIGVSHTPFTGGGLAS